jgi:hypothetical protein
LDFAALPSSVSSSAGASFFGVNVGRTAFGLSAARLIFAPSPTRPTLTLREAPLLLGGVCAALLLAGVLGVSLAAFSAAIRSAMDIRAGGVCAVPGALALTLLLLLLSGVGGS